jgi:ribose transport system ATP-binding protein
VTEQPTAEPRLGAKGISKTFGSSQVLFDVDLAVQPGQIHALVGQNGSGKSTFIKILSGHHAPDSGGSMSTDGIPLRLPVPIKQLRERGISVLHQDFGLIDEYSVVENIRITNFAPNRRTRGIRWQHERQVVGALLEELKCDVDPRSLVGSLGPVDRARVAIARSLQVARSDDDDAKLAMLVFDESTRALPKDALDEFYAEIDRFVTTGTSVLLVSHNLEEVMRAADVVTVLRDGRVVAGGLPTSETSERELIEMMLGYSLDESRPQRYIESSTSVSGHIRLDNVTGHVVDKVELNIAKGEVVGITGLEGSGFEEFPYLITGASKAQSGTLAIGDESIDLSVGSPLPFIEQRIYLVPERRETDGLSLSETVKANVTLPRIRTNGSCFSIGREWELTEVRTAIGQLGIVPPDPTLPAGHLSGGNQQKVLLAKWLLGAPHLLVLHEPTQGVDVGARRDIVDAVIALTETGASVLVATMELELLEELCDRVLIFRAGEVGATVTDVTVRKLIDIIYEVPSDLVGATPNPGGSIT